MEETEGTLYLSQTPSWRRRFLLYCVVLLFFYLDMEETEGTSPAILFCTVLYCTVLLFFYLDMEETEGTLYLSQILS
jgi:hypothetical protein